MCLVAFDPLCARGRRCVEAQGRVCYCDSSSVISEREPAFKHANDSWPRMSRDGSLGHKHQAPRVRRVNPLLYGGGRGRKLELRQGFGKLQCNHFWQSGMGMVRLVA